eukprot:GHVH01005372.1.p1 GENE.GHVH01005372.1~~GHVH01005372.1.p1  ORF type:complete len:242 (-),score=41.96 GHVH01005372.1:655-1380(-)
MFYRILYAKATSEEHSTRKDISIVAAIGSLDHGSVAQTEAEVKDHVISPAKDDGSNMEPVHEDGRTHCGSWLNSIDDLTDFPKFPEDTTSLLSKHLTREVWNEYKDQKDEAGVPFKVCIFSGCKNVDSGVGVYAGSHSSYTQFHKLFDPVIEEYHGHKTTDMHVSNDEAAMVKSTRIRVGRNLNEFALGPGISNEDRKKIMNYVVEACNKFEGDLAGKFYPLAGMSAEDQQQLIDDHFLFK